jgi:hypothetical protein
VGTRPERRRPTEPAPKRAGPPVVAIAPSGDGPRCGGGRIYSPRPIAKDQLALSRLR